MKRPKLIIVLLFCLIHVTNAEVKDTVCSEQQSVFQISNPDFKLSPYTGMTREHWVEAAKYLLEGAFSYINDLDDPMKFPKQQGKSYPHNENRVPTEKLEGLCRTLFVAAPLLKEDSNLVVNNIRVADYYQNQIKNLVDTANASYILPRAPKGGPNQNLVEFGALAISLFVAPDILWEPLSKDKKDALSHVMLSYGDGPTVPSNWKFFNVFVLSFFKDQGYSVNEVLLEKYLSEALAYYRGGGWYNDNPAFDYYSMWAFQLYGVVWANVFGNVHYPDYANKFLNNFKDLSTSYPYMFSKDGEMIMWGRSISYRMGSISPFPFLGLYGDKDTNFGWMRRISSATILQFLQNPHFLKESVPTLGFYGAFEPAVQNYSCRGSVYWMGKAFLGLLVPEDNPFWNSVENNGVWSNEFESDQVYNHFQKESEILITDYPAIGASEIRAWCHEKVKDDWQKYRSTENYNRLSYNSEFPWQADGLNGEVSMNYVIKNSKEKWEAWRLYSFRKFEDGAYYRDVVLETNEDIKMNLVDVPIKNGIIRVDRNISEVAIDIRLGHYSLPVLAEEIKTTTKRVGGFEVTIVDNGENQLAMIPIKGWSKSEIVFTEGLHPVSNKSCVINLSNSESENGVSPLYITLMLWKKSGEKWKSNELMPLKSVKVVEEGGVVELLFKDGTSKTIVF